ncbi:HupE/UreJ family protein [Polaribacter vadi]|uniref:HupE/UreJ family protein n=1 Tax=Polaribacter TaxID=52959 RepID=UPI001C095982|nr:MULTISPECIES: HupE/UreJ family protein [Polaribacter]MBU3012658.1 HupE/UreJ family protein [Polaribacter vadi]MDO6742476.1 HupE/UreJ family protein [Polaribacter sp. 1_MG-2023]
MKFNLKRVLLLLLLFIPFISFAHDVTSADQELLRNGGLWAYIQVGATHMLTGYDHLLFLAGVVFYLKSFKDILKFITVFTIGHCITLIGATYAGITANEHIVDAVIALSVFYKGFENLHGFKKLKVKAPNLLLMVGLFGLIHGFGLSTRLQSFDIGNDQFLAKILCFNLGVELGQVLALIPIVGIITFFRNNKQFPAFYKAVNWYLIFIGIALFTYQIYNYNTI